MDQHVGAAERRAQVVPDHVRANPLRLGQFKRRDAPGDRGDLLNLADAAERAHDTGADIAAAADYHDLHARPALTLTRYPPGGRRETAPLRRDDHLDGA